MVVRSTLTELVITCGASLLLYKCALCVCVGHLLGLELLVLLCVLNQSVIHESSRCFVVRGVEDHLNCGLTKEMTCVYTSCICHRSST